MCLFLACGKNESLHTFVHTSASKFQNNDDDNNNNNNSNNTPIIMILRSNTCCHLGFDSNPSGSAMIVWFISETYLLNYKQNMQRLISSWPHDTFCPKPS